MFNEEEPAWIITMPMIESNWSPCLQILEGYSGSVRSVRVTELALIKTKTLGAARVKKKGKTYNTEDSLVVTHPGTGSALTGFSVGERTGSRVF